MSTSWWKLHNSDENSYAPGTESLQYRDKDGHVWAVEDCNGPDRTFHVVAIWTIEFQRIPAKYVLAVTR